MKCTEVRERLPLFLTGDLPGGENDSLAAHLQSCQACRIEQKKLIGTLHVLDAAPAEATNVNLARLYRQAAERQAARAKHMRRIAVTAVGLAAAAVLVFCALRLEIKADQNQIVMRWGTPPPELQQPAQQIVIREKIVVDAKLAEDMELLRELVYALKGNVDQIESQFDEQLLQHWLLAQRRWQTIQEHLPQLQTAQIGFRKNGERP